MYELKCRCVTRFDWDENKDRTNRNKHGVGFETAVGAFADPNAIAPVDVLFQPAAFGLGETIAVTVGAVMSIVTEAVAGALTLPARLRRR